MANFIAKLAAQLRRIRGFVFRPSLSLSRHPRLTFKIKARGKRVNADAYILWLVRGLSDGSIAFNQKDAFVHFVEEGMLLVSPKAIHVYLKSNDYIYIDQKPSAKPLIPWKMLQRELQNTRYLAFNKEANSHFHRYEVKQEVNDRKRSKKLTGYLIPNERFETEFAPPLNPSLTKFDWHGKVATDPHTNAHENTLNQVAELEFKPSRATMADIVDDGYLAAPTPYLVKADGFFVDTTQNALTSPIQIAIQKAPLRYRNNKKIRRNLANHFINWLQFSLISGMVDIDSRNAKVRITEDGMLHVTDRIFTKSGYLRLLKKNSKDLYLWRTRRSRFYPHEALIAALEEFGYLKRRGYRSSYLLPHYTFFGIEPEISLASNSNKLKEAHGQ